MEMEAVGEPVEVVGPESPTATSQGGGHLHSVLEYWRAFDLDGRRIQLDQQALQMQDAKDVSLRGRKRLAESTKDFRRRSDEEKIGSIKDLLKAYQEEVDALTRRSKFSDNAFYSLYKALYEAPDPAAALSAALQEAPKAAVSELQLQRLKQELADYETEFSKLKNQDITIRKLEDKLKEYDESMTEKVASSLAAKQAKLEEDARLKLAEVSENEATLQRRVQAALDELADAQARSDRAQTLLFESTRGAQEREAAWAAERDILTTSIDTANAQVALLKGDKKELQHKLERREPRSSSPTNASLSLQSELKGATAALEQELESVSSLYARHREEFAAREAALLKEKKLLVGEAHALKDELETAREERKAAQEHLKGSASKEEVDQLKKQILMLQQLEFNVVEEDDTDGSVDPEDFIEKPPQARSMEAIVKKKVRRLEGDLVTARREAEEQRAVAELGRVQLVEADRVLAERLSVIHELEEHLAGKYSGGGGGSSSNTAPNLKQDSDGSEEALLKAMAEDGQQQQQQQQQQLVVQQHQGVDVLRIVQAQRDRFRKRMAELDAEKEELKRQATDKAASFEEMEKDNLKLYEKVRFLQSYQYQQQNPPLPAEDLESGAGLSATAPSPPPEGSLSAADRKGGSRHSTGRYRQMYETRISPFSQFSQREQARKYDELSVPERIMFSTTRMFLGNKQARHLLFLYVVALHLVVFLTMSYWVHSHGTVQCGELLLQPADMIPNNPFEGGNELNDHLNGLAAEQQLGQGQGE